MSYHADKLVDGRTDGQTQATTIPEGQYWPRVINQTGIFYSNPMSLQWRHNGREGIPNHQPYNCLLNRLFKHRSKKTSKLSVTGLCAGNSPVTSEFPAQMASNAGNVSIWWCHHGDKCIIPGFSQWLPVGELPLHAWLISVNWLPMLAVGPHASY